MYKKILIPTDGSHLSGATAIAGVQFARQNRARIFGIFVAPKFQYPIYVDVVPTSYPTEEQYHASMRNAGESYLRTIQEAAETAGVEFSGVIVFSDAVSREIVHAAQENDCDLIFMGSHGRSGWGHAILGSVTTKVLSACQVPVLVHRLKKEPAMHGENK